MCEGHLEMTKHTRKILIFILMQINSLQKKDFALGPTLKLRVFGTRKRSIQYFNNKWNVETMLTKRSNEFKLLKM